ncbi:hypothetical protein GZ77_11135 [Endozoicomonas montiporae]|uniref:Cell shape determination protein CcmA n=2 Tax=Endozoicomonas montiporae TaxID=1027273 RepID=A0A081N8Q0_9GAMM|nr:polymer-forming cytoskeletal protein [Endozoicomonas montiporae]AMO55273.1 protein of unknown function DUF583 [Endozoicomonas montiporae CL-33]KEQ14823.1 hypothetical protein GZ77_11135 [Endozoicomonas montiporae]
MWGKNRAPVHSNGDSNMTLISAGTEVEGNVMFTGTLLIEGKVRGNLYSDDGHLTLTDSGLVEGDIKASKMVLNGAVRGNVFATEHLELAADAEISGNVHYNVIEMVKGSQVNGSLEHHPDGMADIKPLIAKVTADTVIEHG